MRNFAALLLLLPVAALAAEPNTDCDKLLATELQLMSEELVTDLDEYAGLSCDLEREAKEHHMTVTAGRLLKAAREKVELRLRELMTSLKISPQILDRAVEAKRKGQLINELARKALQERAQESLKETVQQLLPYEYKQVFPLAFREPQHIVKRADGNLVYVFSEDVDGVEDFVIRMSPSGAPLRSMSAKQSRARIKPESLALDGWAFAETQKTGPIHVFETTDMQRKSVLDLSTLGIKASGLPPSTVIAPESAALAATVVEDAGRSTVVLWSLGLSPASGRVLNDPALGTGTLKALGFSEDGVELLLLKSGAEILSLDVKTLKVKTLLRLGQGWDLKWLTSSGGKSAVILQRYERIPDGPREENLKVVIVDRATGRAVETPSVANRTMHGYALAEQHWNNEISFDENGRYLYWALASNDPKTSVASVEVYDVLTGKLIKRLGELESLPASKLFKLVPKESGAVLVACEVPGCRPHFNLGVITTIDGVMKALEN